ncbi:MAG: hypothetical protein WCR59_06345 [Planctomycetota bacterium]
MVFLAQLLKPVLHRTLAREQDQRKDDTSRATKQAGDGKQNQESFIRHDWVRKTSAQRYWAKTKAQTFADDNNNPA